MAVEHLLEGRGSLSLPGFYRQVTVEVEKGRGGEQRPVAELRADTVP